MRLTDFFMQIIKACLMISIISSDSSRLIASWFTRADGTPLVCTFVQHTVGMGWEKIRQSTMPSGGSKKAYVPLWWCSQHQQQPLSTNVLWVKMRFKLTIQSVVTTIFPGRPSWEIEISSKATVINFLKNLKLSQIKLVSSFILATNSVLQYCELLDKLCCCMQL